KPRRTCFSAPRRGGPIRPEPLQRSRDVAIVESCPAHLDVDADTGRTIGVSLAISNTTLDVLKGQHKGSAAAYRAHSALNWPPLRRDTRPAAPSVRLSIACGDSVPANTPRTKTKS